jgi:hypothetical protein
MQTANVIGEYAIGGAVAAFLYLEPGTTFDLDIFVVLDPGPSGIVNLGPIFSYLMGLGYLSRREGIVVEGWEVQFLPTSDELTLEGLRKAIVREIDGISTRVLTQEHLMAICLQTARPKDLSRLVQFVQEGHSDLVALTDILGRHRLLEKWATFQTRYLTPL